MKTLPLRRSRSRRLSVSIEVPSNISGQVTPELHSPQALAPREFGHEAGDAFELGAEVGVGGMGTVYSCWRHSTGDKYAAKVISLRPLRRGHETQQQRFLRREINIMKELHHKNIVNFHEAFWENGFCIIVMDLALCGNLFEKIESEVNAVKAIDDDQPFRGLGGAEMSSKYVLNQLIRGIQYMHVRGIIHRDLKLENVLIVNCFQHTDGAPCELLDVKIADFGLSKKPEKRGKRNRLKSQMTPVGTPAYVAPEVLDEIYDERADIWSLGVILYAMLCGCMPFEIRSMSPDRHKRAVAQICDCEPWQCISEEGKHVVRGLLTVDADRRLQLTACLQLPWVSSGALAAEGDHDFDTPLAVRRASLQTNISEEDLCGFEFVQGVVSRITGSVDLDVHHIELHLQNGSSYETGTAGAYSKSWSLAPDELIVAVVQHSDGDHLGSGLVFLTSLCQVIAIESSEVSKRYRFVAPRGFQIIGLQFQNAQLIGIVVERIRHGLGAVEQIGGRTGSAVDQIVLCLRDGSVLCYGDMSGGTEIEPLHLRSDEFIFAVEQHFKDRGLGSSVIFYTSAGNVVRLTGVCAAPSVRFAIPFGSQLCGLDFSSGRLKEVFICPASGDLDSQRPWRSPSTAVLSTQSE